MSYKDLDVWRKSVDLAEMVYRLSAVFPPDERYGITSQIRRAAASVPANIAEGSERDSPREFLHFLSIAGGSLAEMETFLTLATRLGLVSADQTQPLERLAGQVGRMLNGLKRSVRSRSESSRRTR